MYACGTYIIPCTYALIALTYACIHILIINILMYTDSILTVCMHAP